MAEVVDFRSMPAPRRLVFGEVADLYNRNRPSYPAALIEDLISETEVGEGVRALEVGAGTGKATTLFGAQGVPVLAIEPSPGMAAIARRNCAGFANVEIVESDFERWDPRGEGFGLLYSAQAWHWIDPELRYRRARAALVAGGLLAAFWNRPAWGASPLRDALSAVYRREAPDLATDGPMHPDNLAPDDDSGWPDEVAATDVFGHAEVRLYEWSHEYSGEDYAGLVATLSETRLLDEPARAALLGGVRAAIDEHGGLLAMPFATHVRLARAI